MLSVITSCALGWIAGTALQLQQPQLWAGQVYGWVGAAALVGVYVAMRVEVSRCAWVRPVCAFVVACALAFAQAGARASHYVQSALNPALEGRTLLVVGLVANLPQRSEDSARFRFEVESAREVDGTQVPLPPQLLLVGTATV